MSSFTIGDIVGQEDGQVKIKHVINACSSKEGWTFIEVGANDGKSNDPLSEYIISCKWKGVLIEPVEKCFNILKSTYNSVEGIFCERVAIFPGLKEVDMYVPKNTQAASINPKHPALGSGVKKITVPASTLDSIVDKYKINQLDLLYIDAEGYDFIVLQTLTNILPRIIHYEHRHLGNTKSDCEKHLIIRGYKLYFNRNNTIAIMNS